MKAIMMPAAMVGFMIGRGFDLAGHSYWQEALWRGCAAALMAAILTGWLSRIWMQGLRDALLQRIRLNPHAIPGRNPPPKHEPGTHSSKIQHT